MCVNIEKNPGKFEGEPCITKMMYDWMLDGALDDYPDGNDDVEGALLIARGPFTAWDINYPLCSECVEDMLHAQDVTFYEDNNGFAYANVRGDDRED